MSFYSLFAEFSRWLYFILSLLAIMNSFIHLHIQFEMSQCTELPQSLQCIGRNLAWKIEDNFELDTNKLFWRQTFSLSPDIFFDVWPPIIVSLLAFLQHFDTFKCEIISGDWGKTCLFIIVWQLFTVLGYGSNFGVVVGFIGFAVATFYFIICIFLWFGAADIDIRDEPILDLTEYFAICLSVGQQMKRDTSDINHDNDEQDPLSPPPVDNAQDILNRLSMTQPGATTTGIKKKHNYSEIVENDIDSNEEELSALSAEQNVKQKCGALPHDTTGFTPAETGNEIETDISVMTDQENDDVH